ncbi:PRC-barrel domain-containing protein [candidate division WWE3 bacterium]|uniref:PRC-barrel domain-containing protein n=1 Tax=candidate division WWE3 bacterium TaxID=2053526 RepID=A0A955RWN0_UNCKA|nr:PRC-barrel domain-containing protein [candidate division WWE3 bacterium]
MKEALTLSASTLKDNDVVNSKDESIGEISELMIDCKYGRISYAVLSFGGILGMGDKLFAIPWDALKLDTENKRFILNVDEETLKNSEGFDKDNWPDMADYSWSGRMYEHYNVKPYWD